MPTNTQTTNQTEEADRETIFKLFQDIAEYGHRIRTGQKRLMLPKKAESLSKDTQEDLHRPNERQ